MVGETLSDENCFFCNKNKSDVFKPVMHAACVGTTETRPSPLRDPFEHLPVGSAGDRHAYQPSHDAAGVAALLLPLPGPVCTAGTVSLLSCLLWTCSVTSLHFTYPLV